MSVCLSVG